MNRVITLRVSNVPQELRAKVWSLLDSCFEQVSILKDDSIVTTLSDTIK